MWEEGAGGLLLLAAAHETALLSQMEKALPMKLHSLREPDRSPQRSLLYFTIRADQLELPGCAYW